MSPLGKNTFCLKLFICRKEKPEGTNWLIFLSYKLKKVTESKLNKEDHSFCHPPLLELQIWLVCGEHQKRHQKAEKKWIRNLSWAVSTFLDLWKCHIGNLKRTTCFFLTWTLAGLLAEEPYTGWKERLLERNNVTFNKRHKLKVNSLFQNRFTQLWMHLLIKGG